MPGTPWGGFGGVEAGMGPPHPAGKAGRTLPPPPPRSPVPKTSPQVGVLRGAAERTEPARG